MTKSNEKSLNRNNVSATQEVQHLMAGESDLDPAEDSLELKHQLKQCFAALGPITGAILAGLTGAYSAVLIPQLEDNFVLEDSIFTANFVENFAQIRIDSTSQKSWLGFSGALLLAPGCWLSGLMMEKLGRRMTHLVSTPLFFLAWFIVTISPNFITLIIGRILCGLCMGALAPVCSVSVAETTSPRLRGILLGFITVAASIGNLLAHAAGTWAHWRFASLFCGSFNILCFIISFLSPESPTWCLKKGKIEEALAAWKYLRGSKNLKEFETLRIAHAPRSSEEDISGSKTVLDKKEEVNWKEIMVSKSFLKPLGIGCLLFFTAQCSGANAVTFYGVDIFKQVSGPKGAFMWTLILDVVRLLASFLACWFVKRHSNRGIALASGLGTAVVLFLLAIEQVFDSGKSWIPVLLLIIHTATVCAGLVPLSWMLCGELFPTSYKGLGSGLTAGFGFVWLFIVVMTAPFMFDYLLAWRTFLIYGCVAAVGTFLLFCYLPETRGKTLLEIEHSFDTKKNSVKKLTTEGEVSRVV